MTSAQFSMTSVPFVNLASVYFWECFSDNDKWEPALCVFNCLTCLVLSIFLCFKILRQTWIVVKCVRSTTPLGVSPCRRAGCMILICFTVIGDNVYRSNLFFFGAREHSAGNGTNICVFVQSLMLHICIYVRIYAHMCVYMHICAHIYIYARIYAHMYAYMRIYVRIYA